MRKLEQPLPPVFERIEDERLYRKQHLAAAFRLFAKLGFNESLDGHITVRDPELTDHFWINPQGIDFSEIRVSHLILVNHNGDVVQGELGVNRDTFGVHSYILQARPDAIATVHTHSIYGKAWSCLGRPLEPLNQDACAFYEDHSVFDDYTGDLLDINETKRIVEILGHHKAIILRNHGMLTVGRSVDEACWWFMNLERSSQAQLLAEAAGKPKIIGHETARLTHIHLGTPVNGWCCFQQFYNRMVREQPDLLD
ncbi:MULTISPECIES: class II aldolase/adducin family protein [Calothrix]|uniref:Class II aldolase/adducin family protein n=2 Tax=Calothrix TaxID=1186 RepID=A0ABR8A410_9CYAN|nr:MULTISPECIES: class II aldolase/adducin family protein [Calothrix]MBD2194314.1 class II aldolase/adducin family protein [Calothrix parietina FACHB-288]MBD2227078.1 class II aldolase/adducin family protein [Calothrix anomala FACHB-343]